MKPHFKLIPILIISTVIFGLLEGKGMSDTMKLGRLAEVYGPVLFDHEKHMEIESNCSECHHRSKDKEPHPCIKCHGVDQKKGTPLKEAYHGMCIGCHKKISGPVSCGGCHKDMKKGLETIYIKTIARIYNPVKFPHKKHIEISDSCDECHHYNTGKKVSPCSACHEKGPVYVYRGEERKTGTGLKRAYHIPVSYTHL
ncbi:MAG: cytochrome c family protein, partial [Syntrophorhabdaceae bacterium]|nr:cytochrome c family protein [Syntrophorhabdaceae bacterium]